MATDKEIEAGAKAIAADLALPGGGRKKLARVVEDHLSWFDAVEIRGLTWNDVTRLLFAAGAKGPNGRPISIGTLSSAVWRKRKETRTSMPSTKTQIETGAPPPQSGVGKRARDPRVLAGDPSLASATAGKISKTSITRQSAMRPTSPQNSSKTANPAKIASTSKSQTLAFMQRAAAIRRAGKT